MMEQFIKVYKKVKKLRKDKYPISKEKELQSYVLQNNKPAAQRVLNEILGYIYFDSEGSFDYIKIRITELVVILSRVAIEGGADVGEMLELSSNYVAEVQAFESFDYLDRWLSEVLTRFTKSVFDYSHTKHADRIKHIMTYVRMNYMKKISLNDISDHMNLSVSYLSRIFKEEVGQSLSEYINNIRIKNAKLFLQDESVPLSEVAYLSGFEDQSYFSKVFKKFVHITPGNIES